jgi:hypothetical protein
MPNMCFASQSLCRKHYCYCYHHHHMKLFCLFTLFFPLFDREKEYQSSLVYYYFFPNKRKKKKRKENPLYWTALLFLFLLPPTGHTNLENRPNSPKPVKQPVVSITITLSLSPPLPFFFLPPLKLLNFSASQKPI